MIENFPEDYQRFFDMRDKLFVDQTLEKEVVIKKHTFPVL